MRLQYRPKTDVLTLVVKREEMKYAQLSVFGMFGAFITADSDATLLKLFGSVVEDCIEQYENFFRVDVGKERKETILADMKRLQEFPPSSMSELSYDLRLDGNGYRGIVAISETFDSREAVLQVFQPIADDLNDTIENPDDKWTVFGDFFPIANGYEIDELFK